MITLIIGGSGSGKSAYAEQVVMDAGYPIWATTIPQPIVSFLSQYDLAGKTIIPLCLYWTIWKVLWKCRLIFFRNDKNKKSEYPKIHVRV